MIRKGIKLPKTLNVDTAVKSDKFSSDMTIEEFLGNFDTYINVKELEGLAFRTIEDYKWNMKYFTYFLKEERQTRGDRRLMDLDLFRSYMYYMSNEKKLKKTTINIRLRSMKAYLNWLYNEEKLEHNFSNRLKLMKVQDEKVRTLSDREVRKMLKVSDKTTYKGLRTFTIMVLMLDCGPRVSETVSIKVEDVNLREGLVTIRGTEAKSRKYRELPISSKTKVLLKQLIETL